MTTVVICKGCGDVLEHYEDNGPYVEKLDACDKCAREQHEMEYEEAQRELEQEFWG